VLAMSSVHGFFARYATEFAEQRNRQSQKFYRIINEVPTVLLIVIVLLVVLKPF
jgi:putative membrane protein